MDVTVVLFLAEKASIVLDYKDTVRNLKSFTMQLEEREIFIE